MNKLLIGALGAVVLAAAGGCTVMPARPGVAVEVAPPVAYVGPTDVSPGVGYVWAYHPHYGWGWRHPVYGWHLGWR